MIFFQYKNWCWKLAPIVYWPKLAEGHHKIVMNKCKKCLQNTEIDVVVVIPFLGDQYISKSVQDIPHVQRRKYQALM